MAIDEVNTLLAKVALDNCEGFPFENFAHDFLASIVGTDFVPVGGVGDGGADGIYEPGLFTSDNTPNVFYQISIQKNHRPKIKQTIDRLKEFGRLPKRLVYVTSQVIGTFDSEGDELTDKYGVFIKIRDAKYILAHLNNSEATKKAYYTHLSRYTDFLLDLKNGRELKINENIAHPSVYVFLQQQIENKEKDKHLTKSVADSLILWSLNDTDPDKGKFLTKAEILKFISDNIPWAKNIVGGMLNQRLKVLSDKSFQRTKEINYHRKGDKYCLPFDTREIIAEEKATDEGLRIDVINEIIALDILKSLSPEERLDIANCSIRVTQMFFEKEGLICSSFISGNKTNSVDSLIENTVYDRVTDALDEMKPKDEFREKISPIVCAVVRGLFYQSSVSQRILLNKFSRTYILLFTLQAEPRVVEYFQKATANFKLFVGTDLIIRAMSERFLPKENQMTRNLFSMASDAGIKLYLSEPVFDGVIKHLIVTDNEYRHHISPREGYITKELISECPLILIRTYYHAKNEGYTNSWGNFFSEFISYNKLHHIQGCEELKTYIIHQFKMDYISSEELRLNVSEQAVEDLSDEIMELKENKDLANGVSLIINSVYGQRRVNKEHSTFPEYGFQTWWLTQESKVQRHTDNIVKNNGSKYIMRPEFLLNFFSLSPSVADIRESYKTIFPSVMGIQMGNRLPDELFHKVLGQVDIWRNTEEGRVVAKTRDLCDKLKSEHFDNNKNGSAIDEAIAEVNNTYLNDA